MSRDVEKSEAIQKSYIALYRKYRPRSFDEVVGQDHVVSVLRGALNKKELGHAYLFYGSRGIGKTSIARIFAREIGCSPEDIYEIDGASNRKIEDVRALREAVQTLPFTSPYKVYIIDEVHMLTKDAFNALLKTLEEPPAHVIFMLATTEKEKLPDTIISRCQVFTLRKPSMKSLMQVIEHVAQVEKVTIAPESVELIALLGDGSFRDTQGILQKVISVSTDTVLAHSEVERVTGAPSSAMIHDFITALATGDSETALQQVYACSASSIEMPVFITRVLHTLRNILLARFNTHKRKELSESLSEGEWQFVSAMIGPAGVHLNAELLSLLLGVSLQTRQATIPELPLELALMRFLSQNRGEEVKK